MTIVICIVDFCRHTKGLSSFCYPKVEVSYRRPLDDPCPPFHPRPGPPKEKRNRTNLLSWDTDHRRPQRSGSTAVVGVVSGPLDR